MCNNFDAQNFMNLKFKLKKTKKKKKKIYSNDLFFSQSKNSKV